VPVGWLKYGRSKKYHFFIGRKALCGSYLLDEGVPQKMMSKRTLDSDENCKECVQVLTRVLEHLEFTSARIRVRRLVSESNSGGGVE